MPSAAAGDYAEPKWLLMRLQIEGGIPALLREVPRLAGCLLLELPDLDLIIIIMFTIVLDCVTQWYLEVERLHLAP